ncbi:uncharacterized protein LOC120331738 [Styela clava]|uniref:uncharacterized protein LOC120331738 n=1 Tax=Styela clava TaxID=7725 RepID=UPI001939D609|nr:uncharacterized protein LOC120331738 [Styela clava]
MAAKKVVPYNMDVRFLCLDAESNTHALPALKSKIADIPKEKRSTFLNHKDETGNRPLFYATIGRSCRTIEFLTSEGGDPNLHDDDGYTPLFYATGEKDHLETAKCLLENGADPNFIRQPDGISPILFATYFKKPHIVKLLWQYGGNPRIPSTEGRVALNVAVMNGSKECKSLLCDMVRCLDLKEEKRGAVCANCSSSVEKLKRCGKCSAKLYCSKNCQIADWKRGHRQSCKGFLIAKVEVDSLKDQEWMFTLSKKLGASCPPSEGKDFKTDVSHHVGKQFIVRVHIAEVLNNISDRDKLIMVYCEDRCRTYWISEEGDKETYEKMEQILRANESKNYGHFWAEIHSYKDPSIKIFFDRPSAQSW